MFQHLMKELLWFLITEQVSQICPADRAVTVVRQPPRVDAGKVWKDTHRDDIRCAFLCPASSGSVHPAEGIRTSQLSTVDAGWIPAALIRYHRRLGLIGNCCKRRLVC